MSNAHLLHTLEGRQGAETYWREYRNTFKDVKSRFTRITEAENVAVLEGTTMGTLKTGRPIEYRGVVDLLEHS